MRTLAQMSDAMIRILSSERTYFYIHHIIYCSKYVVTRMGLTLFNEMSVLYLRTS